MQSEFSINLTLFRDGKAESKKSAVELHRKSSRLIDYQRYLQSPKQSRNDIKINYSQSIKPTQDPESVANSQCTDSENGSMLQSSLNGGRAQRILVFPYK